MLLIIQADVGIVLHTKRLPDFLLHVFRIAASCSPLDQDTENSRYHAAVIVVAARLLLEFQIADLLLLIGSVIETGHRRERIRRVGLLELQAGPHIEQMLHRKFLEHGISVLQLCDIISDRVVHTFYIALSDSHSAEHGSQGLRD